MLIKAGACRIFLAMLSVSSFSTAAVSPKVSPKFASGVVTSTRQYFRSDCVYFVSSGRMGERSHVVKVQKLLGQQGAIFTKALPYLSLHIMKKKLRMSCNVPVYVMFSDNNDIKTFLMEAAHKINLAVSIWLLIMMTSRTIEDLFANVYIPFDVKFIVGQQLTEDEVMLWEVYRVAKNSTLQKTVFSNWTLLKGFAKIDEFYIRRRTLNGLVLRAANVHNPPVSSLNITQDNTTLLSGFSGEVWKILEHDLDFSTVHSVPSDGGMWGNPKGNGTWDGMINMVLEGSVDVISSATTMSSERTQVVSFAIPLFTSKYHVYIRNPDRKAVNWNDWLAPFTPRLWVAFLLQSIISAVLMVIVCYLVRRLGSGEQELTLYDQMFLVYGALICQQGQEGTPRSGSCRILFFVVYVTGVVLISSYSGSIISNLTVFRLDLPFYDLEGLLKDGHYSLGMLQTTFVFEIFKNAEKGLLKELFTKHVASNPKNLISNDLDGFQRLCETNFAYISSPEAVSQWRDKFNCSIVFLPQEFVEYTSSIAFPKDSPYVGLFNYQLMKLVNNGVLRKIYSTYMGREDEVIFHGFNSIVLEDVTPMLTIVAGGVMAGGLFVGAEHLLVKYGVPTLVAKGVVRGLRVTEEWLRNMMNVFRHRRIVPDRRGRERMARERHGRQRRDNFMQSKHS